VPCIGDSVKPLVIQLSEEGSKSSFFPGVKAMLTVKKIILIIGDILTMGFWGACWPPLIRFSTDIMRSGYSVPLAACTRQAGRDHRSDSPLVAWFVLEVRAGFEKVAMTPEESSAGDTVITLVGVDGARCL
jgi:hypothetical protein